VQDHVKTTYVMTPNKLSNHDAWCGAFNHSWYSSNIKLYIPDATIKHRDKDKENVPPNIGHTSANITKTLFIEKHDNRAPPSSPSSATPRFIATNTLVNHSRTQSGNKRAQDVLTELSFLMPFICFYFQSICFCIFSFQDKFRSDDVIL
jgi:hypothetical protein